MSLRKSLLALGLGLVLAGGFAVAQEGHGQGDGHGHGEMNEEMAAWMKAASPGGHHEHLNKLVGKWKTQGKFWMQPGAPPMESAGEVSAEMILGGRFLRTKYTGDFMGQRFEGIGIDGFDNLMQKHIGNWMDNHGTMIMNMVGSCSEDGKVRTMKAEFVNPMGVKEKVKSVTTIISDDEFTYESFSLRDGGEFKQMEIVHKRQ